jgi:uncharacterized protein YfdQ (DUF2303 family)
MSDTDFNAALAAGAALSAAESTGDGIPYITIPHDYKLADLEHLLPAPTRIRAHIEAHSLDAVLDYLKLYGRPDQQTVVFADSARSKLHAILDYRASDGTPAWCSHTLTYTCPPSLEWQAWMQHNGKLLPLADFAEHIERNLPDITAPDPAAVLEISRGLTGKKDIKFTQAQRLDDGSFELAYEEQVTASSVKGNHKVPPIITLALRPYLGAEPFAVDARLRYRIDGGTIAIGYELIRPERILETKFSEICEHVKAAGWTVLQATWQGR